MSLWKTIHAAAEAEPATDPRKVAQHLLARTKRADLLGLLAEEIAHEQRGLAAHTERQAFTREFVGEGKGRTVVASVTFRDLAGTHFALGTGLKVEWTTATVEQHEQRIVFLRKMRDGIDATIQRHQDAIRLIQEQGATCLADIDAEAAA